MQIRERRYAVKNFPPKRSIVGSRLRHTEYQMYGMPGLPIAVDEVEVSEGTCVVLIGGIHGDEFNAPAVVKKTGRSIYTRLVQGSLVIIPEINTLAINEGTRKTPYPMAAPTEDGEFRANLNSLFNVKNPQTPIEWHARAIFGFLRQKLSQGTISENFPYPGLVPDVHSEGYNRRTFPHIRVDRVSDDKLQKKLIELAVVSGLPWFMEYPEEDLLRHKLDGSLSTVCVRQGIPALTIEAGASAGIDGNDVDITFRGIERILMHIGMLPQTAWISDTDLPNILEKFEGNVYRLDDAWAEFNGVDSTVQVNSLINPGDTLKAGSEGNYGLWRSGIIYEKDSGRIGFKNEGIVVSTQLEHVSVFPDEPFCMIAVPETDARILALHREVVQELNSNLFRI